jgi:hypothetical protein
MLEPPDHRRGDKKIQLMLKGIELELDNSSSSSWNCLSPTQIHLFIKSCLTIMNYIHLMGVS